MKPPKAKPIISSDEFGGLLGKLVQVPNPEILTKKAL
jgi:hypothetical protein